MRTLDAANAAGKPGVAIQVVDSGTGIAPELIGRIFDPFVSTKQQGGTGLGLSISQMLMARQNGSLSVANEAGEGAIFTLWLPEDQ